MYFVFTFYLASLKISSKGFSNIESLGDDVSTFFIDVISSFCNPATCDERREVQLSVILTLTI